MDVLITGAAGFIGRNLARRLRTDGHRVTCIDDLSVAPNGPLPDHLDCRDVRELRSRDLECAETVVHLAARKSVPNSFRDHTQLLHNVAVDDHILRTFTAAHRPRRLLLASSCEVYGARTQPCAEHHQAIPRSPYAVGKLASEHLARIRRELHPGKEISCLRLHNVYGPDEGPDAVVPAFIDAIVSGQPITIDGDGAQARDFTHIDDLVTMVHTILTDPDPAPALLNLGSGTATTVNEIAEHLRRAAATAPAIVHRIARPNEIPAFAADMTRYTLRYGPVPTRPLSEALRAALHTRAGAQACR